MRRPLTAIAGTLAGIALLIGLKFGTGGPAVDGVQASSRGDVPSGQEQRSNSDNERADGDKTRSRPPRTRKPRPRKPRATRGVPNPGGAGGNGAGDCGGTGGGGTGGAGGGGNAGGGTGGAGGGGNAGGGTGGAGGGAKSGTFAGAASTNEYGTIKVTITVANGKMTNVTATFPTTPATTKSINNRAIPKLKAEALAAQSAKIATVSGATFTSSSYRASLQSALNKAGI